MFLVFLCFFFFKQKTAYEMRISDWSSDVCSSDLLAAGGTFATGTDSNIRIHAADELRMIEYAQRLTHRQRNVLAGDTHPSVGARLFSGALAGGAQGLGVETGVAVGPPAGPVALAVDDPAQTGSAS